MRIYILLIVISLWCTSSASKISYGTIKIQLYNQPQNGSLAIALFNSKDGFPYNFNKAYRCKYNVHKDSLYFENIPTGTYAVTVKWDEFYVRPDTIPIAYNHMQAWATSGRSRADFDGAAFKLRKKITTTEIRLLTW